MAIKPKLGRHLQVSRFVVLDKEVSIDTLSISGGGAAAGVLGYNIPNASSNA